MCAIVVYAVVVIVSTDQLIWQGRELFPALSALSVLCGLGVGAVTLGPAAVQPVQVSNARLSFGLGLGSLVMAGLLAVNVYSVGWLVLPALNS